MNVLRGNVTLAIFCLVIFVCSQEVSAAAADEGSLRYLGHAAFLITTPSGTRILTDPAEFKGYKMPAGLKTDIVTISHEHADHNNTSSLSAGFISLRGCTADNQGFNQIDTLISGVHIYNVISYHDPGHHALNSIFIFEVDQIRIAHLGDLGTPLSDEQVKAIGAIDVLLIPVGGQFTITLDEADQIVAQLCHGSTIIPMHYQTKAFNSLPHTGEDFLHGKKEVLIAQATTLQIQAKSPGRNNRYYLLRYEE